MAERSSIEWTDATWNPTRGCTRVSPGCVNCYAEAMATRFSKPGQWGHGFAEKLGADDRWTGRVELIESQLQLPCSWRRPRRIFVNSTSDVFHERLPDADIDRIFAVMAQCPQHIFQCLTKRAARMRDYCSSRPTLPHVWLGVSVEDQVRADERIPLLVQTPAAVRFLSCEPLLGPVNISSWTTALSVVIAGAESGTGARPCSIEWIRSIRDQCVASNVAFFFKQLADARGNKIKTPELDGRTWIEMPLKAARTGQAVLPLSE